MAYKDDAYVGCVTAQKLYADDPHVDVYVSPMRALPDEEEQKKHDHQ